MVIPSSENMFVAIVAVAVMVIVCGRHGLWPSLLNPLLNSRHNHLRAIS